MKERESRVQALRPSGVKITGSSDETDVSSDPGSPVFL